MKAKILVGVSAAGKSTYAKELCEQGDYIALDRDDLRFSLRKTPDWNLYQFDKRDEAIITKMHTAALYSAAGYGLNVVIAETNLNPRTRKKWKGLCEDAGFEVEFVPLHVTLDEAIKRNQARDNGLPESVIRQQWEAWVKYLEETDD